MGLVSTCVQSVGLTLQRKSHILEEEKDEHTPKRAPYRRRRWQIGMLLFLLSNIVGSSIQITTLPLPLLSTLQASGLVFNALLASLLLHEPFTRRTAFGTVLVAGGAVLISRFSALPEPSHTLDQLLDLLVVPGFIVWMTLTLLLVLVITVGTIFLNRVMPSHRRATPRARLIRGMSYGLISGILSAHALLLAKSAVELLVRTIVDGKNQFDRAQAWILLLLFLFLALTQLYYLHHGLKLVSTSILYPFVFCIYNIIAILDGLIYFRQTDRLPALHCGLIALGTAILLTGVLALSWRLNDEAENKGDGFEGGLKADIPHSALAPGLGLVDEEANDVQAPLQGYFDDPNEGYRDEPDDLTDHQDTDAFPNLSEEAAHAAQSERDPLLSRATTQSATVSRSKRKPRSSSDRRNSVATQARRRRSTIREVQAVWEELRDERNWFPPAATQQPAPEPQHRRDLEAQPATPRTTKRVGFSPSHSPSPLRSNPPPASSKTAKRRTAPPGLYANAAPSSATRPANTTRSVSWGQAPSDARISTPPPPVSTSPSPSPTAAAGQSKGGEEGDKAGGVKLDWVKKKSDG